MSLSEWRKLESKEERTVEFRKKVAIFKSSSSKTYRVSADSNGKNFIDFLDLGYGHIFHLFTSEPLLQNFEEMVQFDILCRNSEEIFPSLKSLSA